MKDIKYYDESADYGFKLGMILCQFNLSFGVIRFGFMINPDRDTVCYWRVKKITNPSKIKV